MNQNPSMAGLASLVQSRGRNGDSVLVHMAPEEVKGLQSLALAHGGSLTLNPETGLYEASFLKKLLPTIIGLALAPLTAGTSLAFLGNPLVAGALVGGVEGLRTGDLGKGLMAGLGAFGGAGLGAGLSAAAGSTAAANAAASGVGGTAGGAAAGFVPGGAQAVQAATNAATQAATQTAAQEAAKQGFFNTMGRGITSLATPAGRTAFMGAIPGGMTGLMAGGMGIANAMTPEFKPMSPEEEEQYYYQSYGYDPSQGRFLGGRFQSGYPGYPTGMAEGGAVMPRPNYDYPQAGITKSNYAQGLDFTKPREILDGYDTKIDPFTGEERFADGGPVGVSPGAIGGDPRLVLEPGPVISPTLQPQQPQALPPQQSLEQYYQSLLSAPQQQTYNPAFFDYMQSLNNYVTSPVAPPPPPPPPPKTTTPTTPITSPGGGGNMRWDPNTGKFVPGGGMGTDGTGVDLSGLADLVNSGMFPGFNFGNLSNYLGTNAGTGMTFDPVTGTFIQPGSQTINTPPGTDTTGGDQFKFDPNNYQFNPFVDGFDYTSLPGYQQNQNPYISQDMPVGDLTNIDQFADPNYSVGLDMTSGYQSSIPQFDPNQPDTTYGQAINQATGNLTDINQFADPYYDFAGGTQGFDMGNTFIQPFQYDFSGLGQMGDMGGYGQQFQGFQPLSTDFGSTYQPPAMQTPTFDYSAYNPQQFDLGGMGYGLGSLPAISSTYQAPTVDIPAFDTSSFQMPTYQAPMMTGGDMGVSNVSTAPQFGFGNSDVLYGRTDFGMGGGEGNIFGFAGGGSVQRAAAGKLITGDGDGMSDDIRANINGDQEARLADGEFVIPADVVSHLGNGSTDAGADQLHAMMDRIRKARTGRSKQAPEIDPDEYLPA